MPASHDQVSAWAQVALEVVQASRRAETELQRGSWTRALHFLVQARQTSFALLNALAGAGADVSAHDMVAGLGSMDGDQTVGEKESPPAERFELADANKQDLSHPFRDSIEGAPAAA
jgi:hypothetical protein